MITETMDSHQLYKATARLNQMVSCDNEWIQFDAAGGIGFNVIQERNGKIWVLKKKFPTGAFGLVS